MSTTLDFLFEVPAAEEKPSGVRLAVVDESSANLELYLGNRLNAKKRRSFSVGDSAWVRCLGEATRFCMEEDWTQAQPRHFVAFYALCHKSVYGVGPLLASKERAAAMSAARRMLERYFGGKVDGLIDYMRWVWLKEREDEQRRKFAGAVSDWRVSWRYQFSESLLSKWLVVRKRSPESPSAPPA